MNIFFFPFVMENNFITFWFIIVVKITFFWEYSKSRMSDSILKIFSIPFAKEIIYMPIKFWCILVVFSSLVNETFLKPF